MGTDGFAMKAQTIAALIEYLEQLPPDMDVTCNGSSYFFGYVNKETNELTFTDEVKEN